MPLNVMKMVPGRDQAGPKVHENYCYHLASVVSSVNFSHFKLLLQNHFTNWNQT